MTAPADCSYNTDPLKLVREGTSQDQRISATLDPRYAPVDERSPAHGMVFARAYSEFLKYYNSSNIEAGNWDPFFSEDVSVQLAGAAVEDVQHYRQQVQEYAAFLNDRHNQNNTTGLRDRVDFLFSCGATLAIRLNRFSEQLPEEIALRNALRQLVQSQLAPALKRLIAYHKGGETIVDAERPLNDVPHEKAAPLRILGRDALKWSELATANLSKDWTGGIDWAAYYAAVVADAAVYGNLSGTTVFERVNHLATHNLFTSVLDQFLKVYARAVGEANLALERTLMNWDRHEPHYALFLAFLRLFEHARAEANTLTGRHLDFYYRQILRLKEKAAEPGHAHVLVELARQAGMYELKAGDLFKAGKDGLGRDVFFANDRDVVVNQAKVAVLKTVYRHGNEPVGNGANKNLQAGRLYASPMSNSVDGLGAPLTTADQSWHPFHNKSYVDGKLSEIRMPKAEVGFAIASHYLWMAEGTRTITVTFAISGSSGAVSADTADLGCFLTSEKGWIEAADLNLSTEKNGGLRLDCTLSGADPAVTPYLSKTHGYNFATDLPVLLVKLRSRDDVTYLYEDLQDAVVDQITLQVQVEGLKTLAVSNDFGPVDTSKPFQPFGALPIAGSSLIIGSKEMFQKGLSTASIKVKWLVDPQPYKTAPTISIDFLSGGQWSSSDIPQTGVGSIEYALTNNLTASVVDEPDLSPNEFYTTTSRHGFVRLKLSSDFGQADYQASILDFIKRLNDADTKNDDPPGTPPVGPSMSELSMDYTAVQTLTLNSVGADPSASAQTRFFHVGPFGQAEQHPILNSASKVYLLPQFKEQAGHNEAELYIGVTGLKPPQNLTLLFQVADGTADPLSEKPDPHLHWSYLRADEWVSFANGDVADETGGFLDSGIVTLAMPRDASDSNTLLPSGMHWIRAAVVSGSDAVCRLTMVAAQGLRATFTDKHNDPAFSAKVLPAGTISKLDQPTAAVKTITQPFSTFGGRGAEAATAFYARISERLRHKDRAIALWDYERLILEAFPQLYRAKCLNHTRYEPTEDGSGIYKELAPGHVTVVTIPNQRFQNLRDPLRPYTSLGLLEEIGRFLRKRLSCFVNLHVKNPQFEEVLVSCGVRLREGLDETFYETKLQEAITRFLSPWAFPGGGHPSFGGKIYKSVLINFVEDQPYVDYVTDFQLFHEFVDGDGVQQKKEGNEVEGSKAVSILVSVPAEQHDVRIIKPIAEKASAEQCPCEA
ncbi:MAG: baseplate J/gp47 family protein [Nitrospira sp.]|nr:baseplate J/gp47 family protein [Nitrospira sp.]